MTRSWDFLLNEEDAAVVERSGYGARRGWGKHPAVLVVDAQNKFVGIDAPILNSMEVYPISLGERAWRAVEKIETLLNTARVKNVPIMYSTSGGQKLDPRFDSFAKKKLAKAMRTPPQPWPGDDIVAPIAPKPGDMVVNKFYPSCFFGTPLMTYLNTLGIDTLIVTGFVTAGCVRAAVTDAVSYNFNVIVPEDAVADRIQVSHYTTLLDLDMKYADVLNAGECAAHLANL